MQLEQRVAGGVAIVTVIGDITLNKGGDVLLKDKIHSLIHQGHTSILLDLGRVSHIDSAGLGQLVQAYATTRSRGCSLALVNLTTRLRDLLVVTRLVTVFDTYESEAAAMASFGREAK